ncbi:MAG: diaminopimelate epimerase [Bdellovibrionales bacterium]
MPYSLWKFPLIKVSATGNDFLIADLLRPERHAQWMNEGGARPRAEWVVQWCDRHEGVGADGAVFLEREPSSEANTDFVWDFYNNDGSAAEMCGNAARAISLYVHTQTGKTDLRFRTQAGVVEARVHSAADIEVRLSKVKEAQWNQWSRHEQNGIAFDFVRAGVPHVVVRVPNLTEREDLRTLALVLKREARFRQEGTNVTFVHAFSEHLIESVTFERGVEDFTLSCGTGAVAAAYSMLRGEENRVVEVRVPGGTLSVVWKDGRPMLRGPARIVAEIHAVKI